MTIDVLCCFVPMWDDLDTKFNCARLLADLFLYSYEAELLQKLLSNKQKTPADPFHYFAFRYIDDVLSIKLQQTFISWSHIYTQYIPSWTGNVRGHWNFYIRFLSQCITLCEWWDSFNQVVWQAWRFPYMCINIPESPVYGIYIYISQLIRYVRA